MQSLWLVANSQIIALYKFSWLGNWGQAKEQVELCAGLHCKNVYYDSTKGLIKKTLSVDISVGDL